MKIIIADADKLFTEQAALTLKSYPDTEIIAIEYNGRSALNAIRSIRPDVVLFDLVLPEVDGLTLLRHMNDMPDAPVSICCTRFYSNVSLEAARTFGASYILFKPIELQALHPIIHACLQMHQNLQQLKKEIYARDLDGNGVSAYIRNYIVSLGIPSKLIGCSYLTEAIRLARSDMSLMHNLSKGLYLEISRCMSTTPTRIERCIRTAVSTAYQYGELRNKMTSCPSNKEFINYILRNMQ